MSYFPDLKDESDVSKVRVPQACRQDEFFVKTDLCVEPEDADRLRSLFYQLLSYFLKGLCVNKDVIRGFPPKLGDGVEADLFTLFWVVRKIGDYNLVTKNNLWQYVAEQCGLHITHVGSLKLIYIKYLKELDKWLTHGGLKDTKLDNGEHGDLKKFDSLLCELRGCKYPLCSVGFQTDSKGKCAVVESSDFEGDESTLKCDEKLDHHMAKTEMRVSRINNIDENDEEIGGLDLDFVKTEMGFSGIDNVHDKDKEFGSLDLDLAKTEMGFSRVNNVDENDKKFSNLDERRTDLLSEIMVKKLDISRIKDVDDKRVVLCPMNVDSFQSEYNEHSEASHSDNNTMIFANNFVNNVNSSQKRKKEESLSFSKMLDWVANAARNPHDVAIGALPISSKWKKYKGNEEWKKILLVKETLFAKRNVDSGNRVYGLQKKRHMMHPSMYEDDNIPVHLPSKRIRCSQRVSSIRSCSCPGCTSCSSSRNKRTKKCPQISEINEIQDDKCKDQGTKSVTVEAEVPEWTGVITKSDPKWLGTRMWPPSGHNNRKHEKNLVVIGKGRRRSCSCQFPGSADCVRFHIAEKRKKVKRMLGPVFYNWKFDHMGEEASVSSWSLEEETEFKSLVIKARQELTDKGKSRHEIMNNFWRRASESIPSKSKDVLVSYYFNVFVLRRRSYQNRIMPENIDSDDDEQEVGIEKIDALSLKCSKKLES